MHAVVLLVLAAVAPVDTERDAEVKKELDKLQGVWLFQSMDNGFGVQGRKDVIEVDTYYALVVAEGRFVFTSWAGDLRVDPRAKPPAVDFVLTEGLAKRATVLGCYEVTADSLRLILRTDPNRPPERPTQLAARQGDGNTLYSFRRDKTVAKEAYGRRFAQARDAFQMRAAESPMVAGPLTVELLRKILDRLDKLDKRLDEIEKRLPPEKK